MITTFRPSEDGGNEFLRSAYKEAMASQITDLYGHTITDNYNRGGILVRIPPQGWRLQSRMDGVEVWSVRLDFLRTILERHQFSLDDYLLPGDVLKPLLAYPLYLNHPDVMDIPTGYSRMTNFGEGHLWRPRGGSQQSHLGLVYSRSPPNPKKRHVGVVAKGLLAVGTTPLPSVGALNRYQLIGYQEPKLEPLRTAFLDQVAKDETNSYTQAELDSSWRYSATGEIKDQDGSCLTSSSPPKFQRCTDSSSQKWIPRKRRGFEVESVGSGECLSHGGDGVSLVSCDSQETGVQEDDSWINPEGQQVVLLVPDEAWYHQRDTLREQSSVKSIPIRPMDLNNPPPPMAQAPPTAIPDPEAPDLGFGYSLRNHFEALQNLDGQTEGFDGQLTTPSPWNLKKLLVGLICLYLIVRLWYFFSFRWIQDDPMSEMSYFSR